MSWINREIDSSRQFYFNYSVKARKNDRFESRPHFRFKPHPFYLEILNIKQKYLAWYRVIWCVASLKWEAGTVDISTIASNIWANKFLFLILLDEINESSSIKIEFPSVFVSDKIASRIAFPMSSKVTPCSRIIGQVVLTASAAIASFKIGSSTGCTIYLFDWSELKHAPMIRSYGYDYSLRYIKKNGTN